MSVPLVPAFHELVAQNYGILETHCTFMNNISQSIDSIRIRLDELLSNNNALTSEAKRIFISKEGNKNQFILLNTDQEK